MSVTSPRDWAFVLGRVRVQADRSMRKALKQAPKPYAFHGRKYKIERFLTLLPPLGFDQVRCTPASASSPWIPVYHVTARRGPSRFGVDAIRPFPPGPAHRQAYEGANQNFLEQRRRWVEAKGVRTGGPARELDPAKDGAPNILVLAPHPDDEIIGCGGTLSRFIAAGSKVTCLQATDGSEGAALRDAPEPERRSIRLREAEAVGKAIGFAAVEFWRADNGNFQMTDALVERMRALLESVQPAFVFTAFLADIHPDHFTLNRILAAALGRTSVAPRVFQYEVWGLTPANAYCVVTPQGAEIEKLLCLYRTAMKVDDFVHFCEDRNVYHAYEHTGAAGLVEAYLETDAAEFRRQVEN